MGGLSGDGVSCEACVTVRIMAMLREAARARSIRCRGRRDEQCVANVLQVVLFREELDPRVIDSWVI